MTMKKTEAEAEAERRANLREMLNDDGCCFCHVSAPCSLHEGMTMEEDEAYAKGGAYAVLRLLDAADEADEAEAEAAEQPEQSLWWPAKPHPGLDALPEATRERVRLFLSAQGIGAASQHASADTLLAPSLPDILATLDNLWVRAEGAEALLAGVTARAEGAEEEHDAAVARAEAAERDAEVWRGFAGSVAIAVHGASTGGVIANHIAVDDLPDLLGAVERLRARAEAAEAALATARAEGAAAERAAVVAFLHGGADTHAGIGSPAAAAVLRDHVAYIAIGAHVRPVEGA